MTTVVFAQNPLDRGTWKTFENDCPGRVLLEEIAPLYGGYFPSSGRIYSGCISKDNDVTPATIESAEALRQLRGTVYVVVWPTGPGVLAQVAIGGAILLATPALKLALYDHNRDWKAPHVGVGSPNNLPGDRQNTARVKQRIPDIYGRVKATPDLIQLPYISYQNNLQIETVLSCLGRGEYDVDSEEIFEGTTRVDQIPGASVAIYPPGQVPGSGTPQLLVGEAITDPIYTVIQVREVTGDVLLAPNNSVAAGDDEWTREGDDLFPADAPRFEYLGSGEGTIRWNLLNWASKASTRRVLTENLVEGTRCGLDWHGRVAEIGDALPPEFGWGAVSVHSTDLEMGDEDNIPNLRLLPETEDDDYYEVLEVTETVGPIILVRLAIPASLIPEWEKIALFNDGSFGGDAPTGTMFNRCMMLYVLNFRLGPFFVNDPGMQEVHLNFVAERGLWVDNGREQREYGDRTTIDGDEGISIRIEITPADETGLASGAKETFQHTMRGSRTRRDFIGQTVKVNPSFNGRFLVAVYRETLMYWRQDLPSYKHPTDQVDGEYNWSQSNKNPWGLPLDYATPSLTFEDEIKWTHCYSVSIPNYRNTTSGIDDFGGVTLVHSRLAQFKSSAAANIEKRLNMIVTRKLGLWTGTEFDDSTLFPTAVGREIIFSILLDPLLGRMTAQNIDFESIADAFDAVIDSFSDTQSVAFSHTFDGENTALEDMLAAVSNACFVTLYRQGNVIKGKPDISTPDATLIFNHRNILPGTANQHLSFGTEEEYDGVEIEYTDLIDEQIKIYAVPAPGVLRNARKLSVAGVKTRGKAAMHAWRAFNTLIYQNTTVEFDACEEAALNLVNDKVLVSDGHDPSRQEGDIVAIDGLTVYTSQEVTLEPGEDYTIFIQDVDGTVQSIPVAADDGPTGLVLDGAPSAELIVDGSVQLPRYILVKHMESVPETFQIVETSFRNQGVYSVNAVNYTEGYYFNDGIRLYLPFESLSGYPPVQLFDDRSPYEFEWEETGAITVDDDLSVPSRGVVLYTLDTSSWIDYPEFSLGTNTSYAISVWIYRETNSGVLLGFSTDGDSFLFLLDADGEFSLVHDGVGAMLNIPGGVLNEWQHIFLNYDEDAQIATLYVNGIQIAIAIDVVGFTGFTGIRIFQGLDGRADSYRVWRSSKSPEFIREMYLKERV